MPKPRARRPTIPRLAHPESKDPVGAQDEPEPRGSHRHRYRLYLEIDRRLAAMEPGWYAAQQKAPSLATGGSARPDEPAWDDYRAYDED